MKQSIAQGNSYAFAVKILQLARLLRDRHEFELSKQVLRAGTGIGANIEEALAGISRRDFVAKMSIAFKEARETHYWLRLIRDSATVPSEATTPLLHDADELIRILTAIVKTGQEGASETTTHSRLTTQTCKDSHA